MQALTLRGASGVALLPSRRSATCRPLLRRAFPPPQQQQHATRRRAPRPAHILVPQSPDSPLSSQGLNVSSVTSALVYAGRAFDKCDLDRNGTLTLAEATSLLNSHELQDAALLLTNVPPIVWTEPELKPLFEKADSDKSGGLSRSEFLALYLSAATYRVAKNPLVLAEALLGFIDGDRNGKIEGKELKILLTLLGFPIAMLLPMIPPHIGIDYRSLLRKLEAAGAGKVRKQ